MKTKGRMFIIFLLFSVMVVTLSYTLINNMYQVNSMKKELRELDKKKDSLILKEEMLESDIKRLSDPLYVSKYAREKYLYSKDGEIILRFEK